MNENEELEGADGEELLQNIFDRQRRIYEKREGSSPEGLGWTLFDLVSFALHIFQYVIPSECEEISITEPYAPREKVMDSLFKKPKEKDKTQQNLVNAAFKNLEKEGAIITLGDGAAKKCSVFLDLRGFRFDRFIHAGIGGDFKLVSVLEEKYISIFNLFKSYWRHFPFESEENRKFIRVLKGLPGVGEERAKRIAGYVNKKTVRLPIIKYEDSRYFYWCPVCHEDHSSDKKGLIIPRSSKKPDTPCLDVGFLHFERDDPGGAFLMFKAKLYERVEKKRDIKRKEIILGREPTGSEGSDIDRAGNETTPERSVPPKDKSLSEYIKKSYFAHNLAYLSGKPEDHAIVKKNEQDIRSIIKKHSHLLHPSLLNNQLSGKLEDAEFLGFRKEYLKFKVSGQNSDLPLYLPLSALETCKEDQEDQGENIYPIWVKIRDSPFVKNLRGGVGEPRDDDSNVYSKIRRKLAGEGSIKGFIFDDGG